MPARADAGEFVEEHARWHAGVESRRTAPYGPLSVTALHWLTSSPQRFAGIPGAWSATSEGQVTTELDVRDGVSRDGETLSGHVRIGPLTGIESTTLQHGEIQLELAARGGSIALRTRDPESADRRGYPGTRTFPADASWVVDARFARRERVAVPVETVIPGIGQEYDSPGTATFERDGAEYSLLLFAGSGPGSFRAIFADASGVDLTFPAARSVDAVLVGTDTVRIDFNRATNPPCAYSAGATCPLPPPGNRLPVRIHAGELRPDAVHPQRDDALTIGETR